MCYPFLTYYLRYLATAAAATTTTTTATATAVISK
jgi:hypothetical protein